MLFADWSTTEVGGLMVGLAGLATAIGAVGKSWMDSRHKNKMEEKALEAKDKETTNKTRMDDIETSVQHWSRIATWQKSEIESQKAELVRREAQVREVQQALDFCNEEHAFARQEMTELYHAVERQHEFSVRVAQACKDLNRDPGPVPEMPPRPVRPDRTAMEFRVRTVAQNAVLVDTTSKQHGPPGAK